MSKVHRTIAIIPARLQSSRLPNKPLVDICGMPMIVHVFKRCLLAETLDDVYVATDSNEIREVVISNGGKVIMTSSKHKTGTDRIAEASKTLSAEYIVNIQGDEPLVNPEHIDKVVMVLHNNPDINVGILVNKFSKENSISDIKVVLNKYNDVMYFSRSDIPSNARSRHSLMLKAYHVIPFRKEFLLKYAEMERGVLEQVEYNEYLRILEAGYSIRAVKVKSNAISVDYDEDLINVRNIMKEDKFFKDSLY
jgi:3-deoxy-manno-octulosonate cytidylyltransferase (CMP-KDO synthetase)